MANNRMPSGLQWDNCTATGGKHGLGTEYVLTDDDKPAPDASLAEDMVELQLLTAGVKTGPIDSGTARDHHNF